jgi:pimeloyl-ACP methyl ester carboxylesterase
VSVVAERAGVRLAYDVVGDGPPVLLMMGLGYARWGWGPLTAVLAERFRVVSYDNRGIGESDVPPGPYSTRELAEDAAAVLDAVEFERAHVVATSLGGMAAQELAIASPERVDRLVLACTTAGGDDAYPMPAQTIELMQQAATLAPDVAMRRFVANALASAELVDEITRLRLANPPDPAGWQAQAAAGATHDASGRLQKIAAPTLLLHGTEDAVVDPRNSELLAERIPNARLELLDGAGHLFFWEQPERTAALITEFLS